MIAEAEAGPDVRRNLAALGETIRRAALDCARAPTDITLLAVSKGHAAGRVVEALAAGHRAFGENRVQEAAAKWPALRDAYPGVGLHLIGPLQTNKVKDALRLFDVIETIDRPKLAGALAREMDKSGRRPACLIEVNTGEEPQKGGVLPAQADAFIAAVRDDFALPLKGLMCIPPADEEPSLHFALLREIARRNGLPELSMGMSADYEIAIRFGATIVRVGTALFGPRAR